MTHSLSGSIIHENMRYFYTALIRTGDDVFAYPDRVTDFENAYGETIELSDDLEDLMLLDANERLRLDGIYSDETTKEYYERVGAEESND